jgi:hypothetical protein
VNKKTEKTKRREELLAALGKILPNDDVVGKPILTEADWSKWAEVFDFGESQD